MDAVKRGGPRGTSTTAIHEGERLPAAAALTTPIYETSTFVFDSAAEVQRYAEGKAPGYLYSRYDNPTVVAVEQKLAAIDGAEASLVFSSGMAATSTTLFGLLQSGDEVVCCAAIYGGTYHVLHGLAAKFGIRTRFATLDEFRTPGALVGPATKIVWFESPINPTLRCLDVRAVAAACRAAGVISVADNTFASPLNQPVLAMGVDLSMQSVTKYLNGHSDVTGGVISGRRDLVDRLARVRRLLGGILDPQPAYALSRGVKTAGAARRPAQRRPAWPWRRRSRGILRWPPSTIRGWPRIPTTRSPRRRCPASAAWSASTSPAARQRRSAPSIGCAWCSGRPASAAPRASAACRS